jgi:hypothetical protein
VKNLSAYFSGSIKKGKSDVKKSFWTDEDIYFIKSRYKGNFVSLNPATRSDDLSDAKSTYGRDLLQVYMSDVVIVDLRDRKGIGVGAELMFATFFKIPVIALLPNETHYKRTNITYLDQEIDDWVHPFAFGMSSYHCQSLDEIVSTLNHNDEFISRDKTYIDEAIQHYITNQLDRDKEMNDLIKANEFLKEKLPNSIL